MYVICSVLHQRGAWMSQKSVPEDKRRELRIWMRKKQRERLAVYQKHREGLRERERKPFSTSGAVVRCGCVSTRADDLTAYLYYCWYVHVFYFTLGCTENQQKSVERWQNQRGKGKVCIVPVYNNKYLCVTFNLMSNLYLFVEASFDFIIALSSF